MFGELAFRHFDLAAPTNAAAAAHRIEIDAELAGGFEQTQTLGQAFSFA